MRAGDKTPLLSRDEEHVLSAIPREYATDATTRGVIFNLGRSRLPTPAVPERVAPVSASALLSDEVRINRGTRVQIERRGCSGIADADEALVHRRLSFRELCKRWKWDRIFPSLRPKPSALKLHQRKTGQLHKCGSTSAASSGRSPCARFQIRVDLVRRTRRAAGGSPMHCCRRRRDSFEQAQQTLQFPYLLQSTKNRKGSRLEHTIDADRTCRRRERIAELTHGMSLLLALMTSFS
jgi:hypothetical protein